MEAVGKSFIPFVMTEYGAFGPASGKLVKSLAGLGAKMYPTQWPSPGAWALHIKTALVFELHRGNARMWDLAFEVLLRFNKSRGQAWAEDFGD